MERKKHQKLVNELKHRRSNGEQNLTVHNGIIVSVTCPSLPMILVHLLRAPDHPYQSNINDTMLSHSYQITPILVGKFQFYSHS